MQLALSMLGDAPIRMRENTARVTLLYRLGIGDYSYPELSGSLGNIEFHTNSQCVAYGYFQGNQASPAGAYSWRDDIGPHRKPYSVLVCVPHTQLVAFRDACMPILGVDPACVKPPLPAPVSTPAVGNPAPLREATELEQQDAERELQRVADELRFTTHLRNKKLNAVAKYIGGFVGAGRIARTLVEQTLIDAAIANGYIAKRGYRAAWKTLQSGLRAGIAKRTDRYPTILFDLETLRRNLESRKAMNTGQNVNCFTPATPQPTLSINDIPSVFALPHRPIEFAIPGVIAYEAVTLISGDSGCGKSTFVTALGAQVATGRGFLGRLVSHAAPVLYLDRENPLSVIQERFRRLKTTDGENFKYFGNHLGVEVPVPGSAEVLDWVRACDPKPLVIVDSMIAFLSGSENNATEVRAFMQQLRNLATLGAAVILLHHPGKSETSQEFRGSSDIKAAVDVAYKLRNFGGNRLTRLSLEAFKVRIAVTDLTISYDNGVFSTDDVPGAINSGLEELLRGNPNVKTSEFEKLASSKGFTRTQTRTFIDNGEANGAITMRKGPNNSRIIELTDTQPPSLIA